MSHRVQAYLAFASGAVAWGALALIPVLLAALRHSDETQLGFAGLALFFLCGVVVGASVIGIGLSRAAYSLGEPLGRYARITNGAALLLLIGSYVAFQLSLLVRVLIAYSR